MECEACHLLKRVCEFPVTDTIFHKLMLSQCLECSPIAQGAEMASQVRVHLSNTALVEELKIFEMTTSRTASQDQLSLLQEGTVTVFDVSSSCHHLKVSSSTTIAKLKQQVSLATDIIYCEKINLCSFVLASKSL